MLTAAQSDSSSARPYSVASYIPIGKRRYTPTIPFDSGNLNRHMLSIFIIKIPPKRDVRHLSSTRCTPSVPLPIADRLRCPILHILEFCSSMKECECLLCQVTAPIPASHGFGFVPPSVTARRILRVSRPVSRSACSASRHLCSLRVVQYLST
jgi:hypothetical protein